MIEIMLSRLEILNKYILQKHELENTVFRSNMTARSKRMSGAHMNSPVPVPEAMKGWNSKRTNAVQASPSRQPSTMSQRIQGSQNPGKSVEPSFPGFENSFLQSSPTKSPNTRKTRQKANPPEASQIRKGNSRFNGMSQKPSKGKQRVEQEFLLSSPTKNRPTVKLSHLVSPRLRRLNEDVEMEDGSSSPTRGSDVLINGFLGEDAIDNFEDYNDGVPRMDLTSASGAEVLETLNWQEEVRISLVYTFEDQC
jgi:hypothetical protein